MIREAIEFLINKGKEDIHEINGRMYSGKSLNLIKEPVSDPITLRTLTGLIDYIQNDIDNIQAIDESSGVGFFIHVADYKTVNLYTYLNSDAEREHLITVSAMTPQINLNSFRDTEEFNIMLQSCFVSNEDREKILKVVGNIKEENVKQIGDDGISQSVVAKNGIAQVAEVKVPNPVILQPYRTFTEIEQPESSFVFRMQSGPRCALYEADGGAWKLDAMLSIKQYLDNSLNLDVTTGERQETVKIIA